MGTSTFHGAPTFTSFVIPSDVKTIGATVFLSVQQLKRLTIPSGLTTIEAGAFAGAPVLNCVVYTGSNTNVLDFPYPHGQTDTKLSAIRKTTINDCPAL
jgi:hypothetical protein